MVSMKPPNQRLILCYMFFAKVPSVFPQKGHHTARSSSQVLFRGVQVTPDVESPPKYLFKILFFLKAKKPQQPGTVSVQLTISELLRFSGMSLHLGYLFKIFRLRLIYISLVSILFTLKFGDVFLFPNPKKVKYDNPGNPW